MSKKRQIISSIFTIFILNLFLVGCNNINSKGVINKDVISIEKSDKLTSKEKDNLQALSVKEIMEQLTCDEYLSRQVGTTENIKSAKFIESYFKAIGLEPFNNGSYYQAININKEFLQSLNIGNSDLDVENVLGIIKGEDSSKAVIISAHFDHVTLKENSKKTSSGDKPVDVKITKIQGAVDNASGVATLLESAKDLVEHYKGTKPPYDIIFAAFNAEELGLVGSSAFVADFQKNYDKWYNINIDCIGVKGNEGLAVKEEDTKCQELYSDFIKVLDDNNIYYENVPYAMNKEGMIVGSSDHMSFRRGNSASLVIGQDGIVGTVHTEEDNMSIIDFKLIEDIKDALVDFIIKNDKKIY